jgi:hypothetical protein
MASTSVKEDDRNENFSQRINILKRVENLIRTTILMLIYKTDWFRKTWERALLLNIGFSGHVSNIDMRIAQREGLKPLNRFELWLMSPQIIAAKKARKDAFRASCIDVLGEDPEVDWIW